MYRALKAMRLLITFNINKNPYDTTVASMEGSGDPALGQSS